MTFGAFGVGRIGGKAVMVPGAVVGDHLDVEIVSERRDYSVAKIREVVRASAERRAAPCPYLPRCGGCDWQHIEYRAQVRFKGEVVARELSHALGIEIDPAGLVEQRRPSLGIGRGSGSGSAPKARLDFTRPPATRLSRSIRAWLPRPVCGCRRIWRDRSASASRRSRWCATARARCRSRHLKKPPTEEDLRRARNVLEADGEIAGIVLRAGASRSTVGDATISIELEDGLSIEVDADLFSQVNRAQNRKLVASVMEMAAIHESSAVLDLYCGAGNFSMPAARRGARVTGVDDDAGAIAAAARNAERLKFSGAQFVAMKASATADFLHRARYRPEIIILDPPRTGALDLMAPIVKLRARERDLRIVRRDDAGARSARADRSGLQNQARARVRFFSEHASCGDRRARAIDLDQRAFLE